MKKFILKHKDTDVAFLAFDMVSGQIVDVDIISPPHMPFLGTSDRRLIKFWWENRAIPKKRPDLEELLNAEGCGSSELYLLKNLALSLTDCYWICPEEMGLEWCDVNLFDNREYVRFVSPDGSTFSNSPAASLGGNLKKGWRRHDDGEWYMHKECETLDGQQAANEAFASLVHSRQEAISGNYTPYEVHKGDYGVCDYCVCKLFTSKDLELVHGYQVVESIKKANNVSYYEHFINTCTRHGLDASYVRNFMDYQTLSDYLITNTDRHFNNFGILRDSDTLSFVSMAPIYDSGNSMFYKDVGVFSKERMLGSITVTSFTRNEAELMKYVSNAGVLDLSETPSPGEVKDFYLSMGIDEYKADVISRNYDTKRGIISDFQKGMKVWSYSARKGRRRYRSF